MSNQQSHAGRPFDRTCYSPKWLAVAVFAVAMAALFCAAGPLDAGSIFMKNGYIIQGKIVDRTDGTMVLSWPNGKVTIQRRFIDSVSYDTGEEKRLQDEEALRQQKAAAPEEELAILATTNEPDELPTSLEQLLKTYDLRPKDDPSRKTPEPGTPGAPTSPLAGAPGGEPTPGGTDAGQKPGDSTPVGTATVVARPEEKLGEPVRDETVRVSMRPPEGWAKSSAHQAMVLADKTGDDGFRPSMNVMRIPKAGGLSADEYVALLKEECSRNLKGFELLHEGPRAVGLEQSGYEIVGRGSYQGRSAVMRQVLLTKGDEIWLFSAFTRDADTGDTGAVLEESLKTVELLPSQASPTPQAQPTPSTPPTPPQTPEAPQALPPQ
jgi:hypothetical protein